MIGQKRLQDRLKVIDIETFPKSLILTGDTGCGKHLFCSMLQNKFNTWEFQYVNSTINYAFVENCYLISSPRFYVIDADNLTEREQNVLLKLFEEPPDMVNIILLSTNAETLLNTIINRAIIWEFEKYTAKELQEFLNGKDPRLLSLVTTPGQLLSLSDKDIDNMIALCQLVIDKINNASISNTLSLNNKFFNDKNNVQYDILVFIRMLRKLLLEKIISCDSTKYVDAFEIVNAYYNNILRFKNINKKYLFDNFIIQLKNSLQ